MTWIVNAEYVSGYKIRLTFNDGVSGEADLEKVLKQDSRPIFKTTADPANFRAFRLEADTVVWDTGLDLAPEFLRELIGSNTPVKA
ncbi:MAG: hypothetical protein A2014_05575 [Spirochaetes bacterium GWF1_49_6]|nr:MAG: hypothetical protein A2014_05575 [Spirochaetes bacterium GWF1_49_6]